MSRQNNYDKLLAMFNDTMQGKAKTWESTWVEHQIFKIQTRII